jgi:hypothetical protein
MMPASLVTKLIPILRMPDPSAERDFYELFGLRTTYEGPEYPGFLAVGNGTVEFGLATSDGPVYAHAGQVLQWQLGVSDPHGVIAICEREGLTYVVSAEEPGEDWRYVVVKVVSPNGFEVWFESES